MSDRTSETATDLPLGSETAAGSYFRRVDWLAFWASTLVSFLVYLFTLGPSVTLEDSGELAVAGDHLGVPHPPGYPIWTMCAWVFARMFQWVTFRGQPTPAWSIALFSAVVGAIASGLTAMLITRSSSDMLRDTRATLHRAHGRREDILCWAGGVAGSLLFAFSPVMWSQATIVEVYSLNAFFLMLVLLLTYRWMRRPTDKLLWVLAFVFGLGLTNYQVLLLAALPLVIVIFLRDIALFRDFLMLVIPFLMTAMVLKLGALSPEPGFAKLDPLKGTLSMPSTGLCIASVATFLTVLAVALGWHRARGLGRDFLGMGRRQALPLLAGGFGLACLLLLLALSVTSRVTMTATSFPPLVNPAVYVQVGVMAMAAMALAVLAALFRGDDWSDPWAWAPLLGVMLLLVIAGGITNGITPPLPIPPTPDHPPFGWGRYVMGFGLLSLGLLAIGLTTPRGAYFAVAVFVPNVLLFGLLRKGAMLGLTHPTSWWFWTPVALNVVFLLLGWMLLPHGRTVALTALMAELGVSFYVYMPIVSDLRNPPMNWGYPRTWEGFKHALTRGQYEKIVPTDIFSPRFVQQLGSYFTDLRTQFTLLVAPLGFLPFAAWHVAAGRFRRSRALTAAAACLAGAGVVWILTSYLAVGGSLTFGLLLAFALLVAAIAAAIAGGLRPLHVAIGLFILSSLWVLASKLPGTASFLDVVRVDKLVLAGISLLIVSGGLIIAVTQLDELTVRVWEEGRLSERATLGLVLAGLMLGTLVACFLGIRGLLLATGAAEGAAALAGIAGALLVTAALFLALPYLRRAAATHAQLRFALAGVSQQWLIATVTAFAALSVLLIVLANPKGDLQDAFIQKVKFISSHGLFAIWIGYGIVFVLASVDTFLEWAGRRRAAAAAGTGGEAPWMHAVMLAVVAAALCLPLIPIHENYRNERLVFELGGAEQNGHDYGWQFGNYQLRGAAAIAEELEADEEPLPNPSYPPAMEPAAIFFGGTDPGRFVPTYMIYSARVREDVHLITQNALADNTYMSVMRDLYGNSIWIPTPEDSARAFQVYVDEVQSGKRPRNADLVIENGRVQVSGALGVMEINGILCQMIFDRNKDIHDFYVEESYVIPWMFPYLTPHGLIMKINDEPTGISDRNRRDDLDFWDWYVRRLTRADQSGFLVRDGMFRRDIVAQKSFSKLRSAIGGAYAAHGMVTEAEQAFREALMLYPVSPEANFRLIQEVLMRKRRYAESLDLLGQFIVADPNNDRGPSFRDFIQRVQQLEQRINQLMAGVTPGQPPEPAVAWELARAYRDLGNNEQASRILTAQLEKAELPGEMAAQFGVLLDDVGNAASASRAMDLALAKLGAGAPAEMLLTAARIHANANQPRKMIDPLNRYLRLRPNDWQAWLDLATLYGLERDSAKAQFALRRALELGQSKAAALIRENPQLRQLAAPLFREMARQPGDDFGLR